MPVHRCHSSGLMDACMTSPPRPLPTLHRPRNMKPAAGRGPGVPATRGVRASPCGAVQLRHRGIAHRVRNTSSSPGQRPRGSMYFAVIHAIAINTPVARMRACASGGVDATFFFLSFFHLWCTIGGAEDSYPIFLFSSIYCSCLCLLLK